MYLELSDNLLEKISKISGMDYELKGNFMPSDKVVSLIEDLLCEIESKQEKIDDLEQNIEDNYERINIENQI
jgi:hypothetical protein